MDRLQTGSTHHLDVRGGEDMQPANEPMFARSALGSGSTARLRALLGGGHPIRICPHLDLATDRIAVIIESMLQAWENNSLWGITSDVHLCRRCKTQYQLEMCDLGDEGRAIVVTKWLDLGAGLTPEDPKWQAHLSFAGPTTPPDWEETLDAPFRFEREPGVSQRALFWQIASYLKGNRFMVVMKSLHLRTWYPEGGLDSRVCLSKSTLWPADVLTSASMLPGTTDMIAATSNWEN